MTPPPSTHTTAIADAADALRRGECVVFPTETVYGLGADATRGEACARIYQIKGRPSFNPLIVHIADRGWLDRVTASVPHWAHELAERFWPGPLTLILPKGERIAEIVTAGLGTVAVRVPRHPVAQALLRAAGTPIAAPSANRFTRLSPTRLEHARAQLRDAVHHYLDGGPCEVGLESTIIASTQTGPVLLRPGGVPPEAIEEILGPLRRPAPGGPVQAPGMLRKHYAPVTPLFLDERRARERFSALGLLTREASDADRGFYRRVEILGGDEDLRGAAAGLFSALDRLERAGLQAIVARLFPETGLGVAINDRLRRAAVDDAQ